MSTQRLAVLIMLGSLAVGCAGCGLWWVVRWLVYSRPEVVALGVLLLICALCGLAAVVSLHLRVREVVDGQD